MHSGDEWILPMDTDLETLKECTVAICELWNGAVVEDTAAGEFAYSVESLVPTEESELCVYRDLEVTRRWQHGARGPELFNSMIQIGFTSAGLRLIADDWQDPQLATIVTQLANRVGKDSYATSPYQAPAGHYLSARDRAVASVDRVADDLPRKVP